MRGYSLIELCVVMLITAILAGFLCGGMARLHERWLFQEMVDEFIARIHEARWLAIIYQHPVNLEPIGNDWSHERLVSDNTLIKNYRPFPSALTLTWRGFPIEKNALMFDARGLLVEENGSFIFKFRGLYETVKIDKLGSISNP